MYFEKGQDSFGITNWQIAGALLTWTCQIDPDGGPDYYRPSTRQVPFTIVEEYRPSAYRGMERVSRQVEYTPLILTHAPLPTRREDAVHWLFVIDGDPELAWFRTMMFCKGRLWIPDDFQVHWAKAQEFLMKELETRQRAWMKGLDHADPKVQRMEKQTTWQRNQLAM